MGKGGKGTSGNCGNKSAKGKGDEEDEVTNVRNYHWRPNDTPEIGGWLHQQVATKGSGKFSKKGSDEKYRALELGSVMLLKYRSSLPMLSTRPRPERLYIPYCIKNVRGTEEDNPFLEAWL